MIQVIHNPNSTKREQHLRQQLEWQGITDWAFSPAVMHHYPVIGVMEAHHLAVKQFTNYEYGIVFEDDIRFTSPKSWEVFMDGLSRLPDNWDIYVGGAYLAVGFKDLGNGLAKAHDIAGLHCYAIHNRFYDKFLSCKRHVHIDRWCKGSNIFITYPFVALQMGDFSERQNSKVDYRNRIKKYKILT